MKVRPNPFGTAGTAEMSDCGVSNLVLLPRRNEEIEKMMLQEKVVEESKNTRTLCDAERLTKNDTRAPPRNYYTLKFNVGSTVVSGVLGSGLCSKMFTVPKDEDVIQHLELQGGVWVWAA
jgi:hypothetical protein